MGFFTRRKKKEENFVREFRTVTDRLERERKKNNNRMRQLREEKNAYQKEMQAEKNRRRNIHLNLKKRYNMLPNKTNQLTYLITTLSFSPNFNAAAQRLSNALNRQGLVKTRVKNFEARRRSPALTRVPTPRRAQ
jgi:hypothetical protein